MALTRRLERVTKHYEADGTLRLTEFLYYDKPEDDADNPGFEMPEKQCHATVNHGESGTSDPDDRQNHNAGDLTAGQKTKMADGVVNDAAVLSRLVPLNPGP